MSFFQVPPRTQYDLNFSILDIPVRVHPMFWLMTVFLGASSNSLSEILIWMGVVFVSILVHELGHSLMMRRYEQASYIVLHLMGGLAVPTTSWNGARRRTNPIEQILISLAGPFAGFFLAGIILLLVKVAGGEIYFTTVFGFLPYPVAFLMNGNPIINSIIGSMIWVNFFWGLLNLIPVFPLDGGQVSRNLFMISDPQNGVRNSLWLSVLSGGFLAILGLIYLQSLYMGFLFGMLAFQSYQQLQMGGRF